MVKAMNINKEDFIETTTKFNELKKKFNNDMIRMNGNIYYVSATEYKLIVLQDTVNEMLTLLDEMLRK